MLQMFVGAYFPISLPFTIAHLVRSYLQENSTGSIDMGGVLYKERKSYRSIFRSCRRDTVQYGLQNSVEPWQHAPSLWSQGRASKQEQTHLLLRETGLFGLAAWEWHELNSPDAAVALKVIKRLKMCVCKLNMGRTCKSLGAHLATRIQGTDDLQVQRIIQKELRILRVGSPFAFVVFLHSGSSGEETQLDHLATVLSTVCCKLGGEESQRLKKRRETWRVSSRPFHGMAVGDPSSSKKGRRTLVFRAFNAVQIAYGIDEGLDGLQKSFQHRHPGVRNLDWELFLHYWNPLVLGGKCFHRSPLGSGLQRSWFIESSLVLRLREKFPVALTRIHQHGHLEADQLYYLLNASLKLPGLRPSRPLFSGVPYSNQVLKQEEKQILEILMDQARRDFGDLMIDDSERSPSSPWSYGLTKSKITDKMGLHSGRNTVRVYWLLQGLKKKKLIDSAPHKAPGRGKFKQKFFISKHLLSFRDEFAALIESRFPAEIT